MGSRLSIRNALLPHSTNTCKTTPFFLRVAGSLSKAPSPTTGKSGKPPDKRFFANRVVLINEAYNDFINIKIKGIYMKSIGVVKAAPIEDPESLIDRDIPLPSPGPNDLLVRVHAISVNPADYRMRQRKEDDGQFVVLGWDVAGEVVASGKNVTAFVAGDKVYYAGDLTRPGANSEYHVVDEAIVGHAPISVDLICAAALPLTTLTAWEALFDRMGLSPEKPENGKTLLIVGGAGGVGSMAIQLARLVPGLQVIATASRPESRDWCEKLGAHAVINHFGDMAEQLAVQNLSAPDLILLLNDPDRHYPALADMLAPQGKLCCIVPFKQDPNLNLLMRKSASFLWEFMFTRAMFSTADKSTQGVILNSVAAMIDNGRLISTATQNIGAINAANLRAAHLQLESGRTIGKLLLSGF
ncbi:zinc-binding alcohol dehydrogenase family protein [Yersinia aldovae]|nr:zinc-binding alcohol dehydrogenase family protein [Yersinia aldovae]